MDNTRAEPRYARNPDLLAVDMDGDLVMMSIEHGNYYGVGGIGPHVWQLLETPRTTAELIDDITRIRGRPNTALADMNASRHLVDMVWLGFRDR